VWFVRNLSQGRSCVSCTYHDLVLNAPDDAGHVTCSLLFDTQQFERFDVGVEEVFESVRVALAFKMEEYGGDVIAQTRVVAHRKHQVFRFSRVRVLLQDMELAFRRIGREERVVFVLDVWHFD
jgi:hypothetical protein